MNTVYDRHNKPTNKKVNMTKQTREEYSVMSGALFRHERAQNAHCCMIYNRVTDSIVLLQVGETGKCCDKLPESFCRSDLTAFQT